MNNPASTLGSLTFALSLLLPCTLATPAAAADVSASPGGNANEKECPDQVSSCGVIPPDPWPRSVVRVGFTAMLEGNFMPVRAFSAAGESIWRLNFPIGLDIGGGGRNWWTSLLIAPVGLRLQSDKLNSFQPVQSFISRGVYLTTGFRGIHLTLASPEFDWSGKEDYKVSRTTLGLGLVLVRLPQWGSRAFMPEWFGR